MNIIKKVKRLPIDQGGSFGIEVITTYQLAESREGRLKVSASEDEVTIIQHNEANNRKNLSGILPFDGQFIISLIVTLTLCLGFLAVTASNLYQGKLEMKEYLICISTLLAGLGIGQFTKK